MTIAAFLIGGAAAWLHLSLIGPVIAYGVKVWPAWMALVIVALGFQTFRAKDREYQAATLIMLFMFVSSHLIWTEPDDRTLKVQSLKNTAVAGLLFIAGFKAASLPIFIASALHIAIVAVAFAADRGLLFSGERPMQFIAWSYPDVAAGFQHAALLVLGFGCRQRERAAVERDYRSGDCGGVAGLAGVASMPAQEGRSVKAQPIDQASA